MKSSIRRRTRHCGCRIRSYTTRLLQLNPLKSHSCIIDLINKLPTLIDWLRKLFHNFSLLPHPATSLQQFRNPSLPFAPPLQKFMMLGKFPRWKYFPREKIKINDENSRFRNFPILHALKELWGGSRTADAFMRDENWLVHQMILYSSGGALKCNLLYANKDGGKVAQEFFAFTPRFFVFPHWFFVRRDLPRFSPIQRERERTTARIKIYVNQ